jgi:cytochrome c553
VSLGLVNFAAVVILSIALGVSAWGAPLNFNRDIRPILSENCFYCHGQDGNKRKADLRLDEQAAAHAVLVPGNPTESLLIERINATEPDELMPPPDSNRLLSAEQKALLKQWVEEGADYETHWAFVTPEQPPLPAVAGIKHPIDRFVRAKLRSGNVRPSPEANPAVLIRRLYLDLIGLLPTPAEVDAFVTDADPLAYENLVTRLLGSPHYGERMALPWLDAARYADSNGFQQDGDTWQWMWRDWVIRSLNEDQPFDQFTTWQLAGDLLSEPTTDQLIASGFNRNHLLNGEGGAIPEEQRFVVLFDRVDTTSTTWLGLTVACAQCHDHKYDPITQKDYYSLMDVFNHVPETGTPQRQSSRIRVAKPFIELPTEENKRRIASFEAKIATAKKNNANSKEVERLEKALANYKGDQIPRPMVMSDTKRRDTHILNRGEYLSPTEKVRFNTPAFLPKLPDEAPKNRLGLAQWLLSPEHPLTARVQVNRMWQHFFGIGIVKTSEDFGVQSEYPIHGALLDWLAVEFRESGWSRKAMHRLIVTSATYKQSSRFPPDLLERDPENRLYARASRFRLPSLLLRDIALQSAGLLERDIGGAPVYPYQPDNVWESLAITKERDFTYPASSGADLYRRSLYTFWRRTVGPTNMFDASSRQACRVRLSTNNTPLHALTTLNGPTWVEAARHLAARSLAASEDTEAQLAFAFREVLGRQPEASDHQWMARSLGKQRELFQRAPEDAKKALLKVGASPTPTTLPPVEHAAMTAVCLAILNIDEALTRQ